MAAFTSGSSTSDPSPSPKILLAKPGLVTGGPVVGKFGRGGSGGEDELAQFRSRLPSVASLNLLSDSWEFHIDRFLPVISHHLLFCLIFYASRSLSSIILGKSKKKKELFMAILGCLVYVMNANDWI